MLDCLKTAEEKQRKPNDHGSDTASERAQSPLLYSQLAHENFSGYLRSLKPSKPTPQTQIYIFFILVQANGERQRAWARLREM